MIYAKINTETGEVLEFEPSPAVGITRRMEREIEGQPLAYVEVDTETNRPERDWTKAALFDQVVQDGENYVMTYTVQDRFETVDAAVEQLNKILAANRRDLNRQFQTRADRIVSAYPDREVESWDQQLSEAKIYLQELTTDNTPLLANMATARQMDPQELATRIVAKADAFAIAFGQLLGKKHRNEDILDTLESDPTNQTNWSLLNQYGW